MKTKFSVCDYRRKVRPELKAVVRWKETDGKWKAKFFETKAEAKTYAQQRQTELLNQGRESIDFPTRLRVMAQRCDEMLAPYGKTIEDATLANIGDIKARATSCQLGKTLIEFVTMKEAQGVTREYLSDLKIKLREFSARHLGSQTCDITTADCNAFIASHAVGARTKNLIRAMLVSFFSFAQTVGHRHDNPAAKSARFKAVDVEVGIVTPDELARLLEACCPQTLAFVAIGAFAGVRVAETLRLDWSDIDFEDGFIQIRARNAKTAKRRLISIKPCLRAWLEPLAKRSGPLFPQPKRVCKMMRVIRARAGLDEWPQNALRHSFASYHLAQFNNAPALALEMGHAGCNMIFAHYRQIVRQADAFKYWNILPADPGKVLELANGNEAATRPAVPRAADGRIVSASPARRAYQKTQYEYARMHGVCPATIRRWQDLGHPLDLREEMAGKLKPRYAKPLRAYCAIYGKNFNSIVKWAKGGWPLDDVEAVKAYLASCKARPRGTAKTPPREALRLLPFPAAGELRLGSRRVRAMAS